MSSPKPLRVGIIGASPDRGWALDAHIPALRVLSDLYQLTAVATSRPESAKKAEEVFKCKAYSDFHQLVKDPEVDVVIVSVKVPEHLKLTTAAIEAKKHVICEWPLGRNTAEAIQLAELADKHGVKTVVGLQARGSPAFAYIKDLIKEGYIGELLSTTTVGQGAFPFNGPVPPFYSYLLEKSNGATNLTIPFSHYTDAMQDALGREFIYVSANLAVTRPKVPVSTGELLTATSPDEISVSGTLEGGILATIAYRFYAAAGPAFTWNINGTKGCLVVTAPSQHVQMVNMEIQGSQDGKPLQAMPVPEKYTWVPAETSKAQPLNVAQAYVQAADDWAGRETGRAKAPTFWDAVKQHRFVEAIEEADRTGVRQDRGENGIWHSGAETYDRMPGK